MRTCRRFSIERKSFELDFSKDVVKLTEKCKKLEVTVSIEVDLVKWLIQKLKRILEDEPTLGSLGSRRGKEMDLVLSSKKNKAGCFLSFLCLYLGREGGCKVICFPQGRLVKGWKMVMLSMLFVLGFHTGDDQIRIGRRTGSEKVVAKEVCHDTVREIREESLILKASAPIESWEDAEEVLRHSLELISYKPSIVILTRLGAMVEFNSHSDQVKALSH